MLQKLFIPPLVLMAIGRLDLMSAQDTPGTILGTGLDASGAIVPGAKVLVTNTATGVAVRGATNNAGEFNVPFLHPGTYRIMVQKTGFKTYTRGNIQLRISESVGLTVHSEIGSIAQQVNVHRQARLCSRQTRARPGRSLAGGA